MENEYKIGKIHNYDGFAGEIITDEQTYIFNNKDFDDSYEEKITNGDLVEFIENTIKFADEHIIVAKNIKKYEKKKGIKK